MNDTTLRRSRSLGELLSVSLEMLREHAGVLAAATLRVSGPVYLLYGIALLGVGYLSTGISTDISNVFLNSLTKYLNPTYSLEYVISLVARNSSIFLASTVVFFVGQIAQWFFIATTIRSVDVVNSAEFDGSYSEVVNVAKVKLWKFAGNAILLSMLIFTMIAILFVCNVFLSFYTSVLILYATIPTSIVAVLLAYIRYFSVAYPLFALENCTFAKALRRNVSLTRGHSLRLFGYALTIVLISFAFGLVTNIPIGAMQKILATMELWVVAQVVGVALGILLGIVLLAFSTLFSAYVYGSLVVDKGEVEEDEWFDEQDEWELGYRANRYSS